MIGLDLLDKYADGLPSDYFDEVKKKIIAQEPSLLFVPNAIVIVNEGKANQESIESHGIFSITPGDPCLTTGYKYPVPHSYDVVADLGPSEVVFDWVEQYYYGSDKKFPHCPISNPAFPQSRLGKSNDFYAFYQYFINHGYQIYRPTVGQETMFPHSCTQILDDSIKYIFNYINDFKQYNGIYAVMLDFNPYNPIGVMSIKRVYHASREEVRYVRVWKDKEIEGKFDKTLKRYHYDSWGQAIVGKNYFNKVKISAFDVVVKRYSEFEKIVNFTRYKKKKQMLSDPILVEAYYLPAIRSDIRSNMRKHFKIPEGRHVYDVARVKGLMWSNHVIRVGKIECDSYIRLDKNYFYNGKEYDLSILHFNIMQKLKNGKEKDITVDEQELSEKVFVQRKWVSLYDGESVKRDEYTRQAFQCAYIKGTKEVGFCYDFTFVPYRIARYPYNTKGTLINSMFELNLEEFVYKWEEIYTKHKFPGWLESIGGNLSKSTIMSIMLEDNEFEV